MKKRKRKNRNDIKTALNKKKTRYTTTNGKTQTRKTPKPHNKKT